MIWNCPKKQKPSKIEVDLIWTLTLVIHRLIKLPSFLHVEFPIASRKEEPKTLENEDSCSNESIGFREIAQHIKSNKLETRSRSSGESLENNSTDRVERDASIQENKNPIFCSRRAATNDENAREMLVCVFSSPISRFSFPTSCHKAFINLLFWIIRPESIFAPLDWQQRLQRCRCDESPAGNKNLFSFHFESGGFITIEECERLKRQNVPNGAAAALITSLFVCLNSIQKHKRNSFE